MLILFLPERINVIINITLVSPSYLSICQSRLPFAFPQVQGKAENAVQRGGKWEGQSIAFETEHRLLLLLLLPLPTPSAIESFENGPPYAEIFKSMSEEISIRFIRRIRPLFRPSLEG